MVQDEWKCLVRGGSRSCVAWCCCRCCAIICVCTRSCLATASSSTIATSRSGRGQRLNSVLAKGNLFACGAVVAAPSDHVVVVVRPCRWCRVDDPSQGGDLWDDSHRGWIVAHGPFLLPLPLSSFSFGGKNGWIKKGRPVTAATRTSSGSGIIVHAAAATAGTKRREGSRTDRVVRAQTAIAMWMPRMLLLRKLLLRLLRYY